MGVISQLSYRKPQALDEEVGERPRDTMNSVVLPEPQFNAALRREVRRTERSEKPFLLMLATMETASTTRKEASRLEGLGSALAASTRETDIVGWHRRGEVVGAIFTELGTADKKSILASVKHKISTVVNEKLPSKDAGEVNLTFRFFPEDSRREGPSVFRLPAESDGEQPKAVARTVKRAIDITGSTLALVVLSPVLLAISLLIKLTSKGPVLFCQRRVGQLGKEFTFLKFRSMCVNNDVTVHKEYVSHFIAGQATMQESADGTASAYKVIDDPRVTPFGRFLRKTSLDELPQLINVVKGEMSLVGPRPPIPYELASYELWHLRRIIEAKPGITGLWQVCGRSKTSFDEMVRLDLRYARGWSLSLDFKILLRTPGVVLSGDGAY
jgi:lipopolysaccharide/colanic/teichoic acid biosynthesis glycosyltransferase